MNPFAISSYTECCTSLCNTLFINLHVKRQLLLALTFLFFGTFLSFGQTFCEDIPGRDCDDCPNYTVASNPDLTVSCEQPIDVILIIDESNSIGNANAEDDVQLGVETFLSELECTPVRVAIIEFGSQANYVVNAYTPVANVQAGMTNYFTGTAFNGQTYNPDQGQLGGTNWQAALVRANALPTADLVLMFTDGVPTTYSPDATGTNPGNNYEFCGDGSSTQEAEIYNAVQMANVLKSRGSHMFILGVGNVDAALMNDISDTDEYGPTETIATADFYVDPNFATLADCFASLADSLCPIPATVTGSTICEDETTGVASINILDGVGPFEISGAGFTNFTTSLFSFDITGLSPGNYGVTILDTGNPSCFNTGTFPVEIIGTPQTTPLFNTVEICVGDSVDILTLPTLSNNNIPGAWSEDNGVFTFTPEESECALEVILVISEYPVTPDDTASGEVCVGDTFNYEGTEYEVGSYDIPRTDNNGCSYKTVLTVTAYEVTPDDTASGDVCVGDTFNYEGTEYEVGSYDIPRTDNNGCPYKTVLTVSAYEVTPDDTASGEVCVGDTFNYEGTEYEVGSYDIPRTDDNGCSYKTVLTVSAYEVTPDETVLGEVCVGDTFNYEGTEYEVGSYDIPRTDDNGCSYKTVLTVSAYEVTPDDTASGEVCVGDKFTYEGTEYEVGSYDIPRVDNNGCSYKTVLTVSAYEVTPDDTASGEVCVGDTFNYEGTEYEVGSYDIPRTDNNGCSYKTVLTVTAYEVTPDDTASGEVCVGDTFNYEGTEYEVGSYDIPRTDNNGCSYKTVLTVTAYEVTPDDTASGEVCVGDTFNYEGTEYEAGVYDIPRVDNNGCSYKTVLTVSAYEVTPDDTASGEVCVGDKFTYEGTEYEVGSYDIPRVDNNGCSYKTVLTVTAYEVTPDDTASGEVCVGDTFNYEGTEYEVGSYDIPRVDNNGCSYKTVLTVTAYEVTPDDTASGEVCVGDTFNYEGTEYEVGSYDIPRTDDNGCSYKTVLTVSAYEVTPDDTASGEVCVGDTFNYEGTEYEVGSYDIPRVDNNGCSYKTVLTVTAYEITPDDTASGEVCVGDTFNYEGTEYEVGSYDIPRTDNNGCSYKTVLTVIAYEVTPDDTASGSVCTGNTFNYEGTEYEAGVYDIPRIDSNGCSYKTVLTVTAFDEIPDDTASGSVCVGDTFNYEGTEYEVGVYDIPRTDSNGCTYKTVLTVTAYEVTPDDTASGEVCVGDTFNYEGTEYEVGSYDIPRVDNNGCSYKTVLTVTAYEVTPDDTASGEVCVGDTFNYEGTEYEVGSYDIPRVDNNGCSYKTVLTVTAYEVTPDDTASGEVCVGDTFNYEGTEYEVGSYDIPRTDDNGCSYKTVLTVSAYEVTPDDTASGEVCVGDTFNYEGTEYEVGSYDIPRVDNNGCSYKTVLTVTAYEVTPDDTASGEVCVGDTFNYEGTEYEVGSYDIPRVDNNGCSYKTVLTVTAYEVTPDDTASGSVCTGNTFNYEGTEYEAGVYDIPRIDSNGCSYKTVLTVTAFDEIPDDTASGSVCVGDTFNYEGTEYEVGVYDIPRTDSNGCTYKTVLTVTAYEVTPDDTASGEVCVGDTFNYEGTEYEVGSYDIPRTDGNGCSYKTVLTVTAYEVTPDDTASGEVCVGDTFNYEGTEYEVGSYDIPRVDNNGCSYKTVLTVSAYEVTPDDTASGEVCVGDTFNYEGTEYEVGSYDIPRTDGNGCSYKTVLTVTAYEVTPDDTASGEVCVGDTFNYEGTEYEVGSYDIPRVDNNGCSYKTVLTVTAYEITPDDTASGEVCVGDTFNYEGTEYEVGSYDIPRTDNNGCSYKTVLTVIAYEVTPDDTASGSVCTGNTFNYEGTEYEAGVYDIPRIDSNGCSYKTVLTVTAFDEIPDDTASGSVCVGDTFNYEGTEYEVGVYDIPRTDSNGCTYKTVLTVTAYEVTPDDTASGEVCVGDTFNYEGTEYEVGSYDIPRVDNNGCSYKTVLTVTAYEVTPDDTASGEVCVGDTFNYEGTEYEVGSYDIPRVDNNGCSYKTVLTVTAYEVTPDDTASGSVCTGNTFNYEGTEYEAGVYDIPRIDSNGCSYKTVLTVTAYEVTPDDTASGEVCVGDTFNYEGTEYEVGSYDIPRTDNNGCSYKTVLTVSAYEVTPDFEFEVAVCEGDTFFWEVTGQTYSADDSPVVIELSDDNGCSYNGTLTITTIDKPEPMLTTITICEGAIYTWEVNGETYTESQTVTIEGEDCQADKVLVLTVTDQPEQPVTECYETATFNPQTCEWEVTGEQPDAPVTECYETATFNNTTCEWEVKGDKPEAPITACYEIATFSDQTCEWEVTGEQPEAPITACYETATFSDQTCEWEVTGEQPEAPVTECYETATFNNTTCEWEVKGDKPEAPITACYEIATFSNQICEWEVTGEQPEAPVTACYETATFSDQTCEWEVTGEQPEAPVTDCYETATFNDTTCEWEVTGEQPEAPVTECYETATFSGQTCEWEVTGEQPEIPETKCFETATFNKETCSWDITGEEPEEPLTKCFETATFNKETCSWDITGEQPEAPATACYEVTTFNEQACEWEVTGEQPEAPVTACYETATFSDQSCEWEVTGEQPEAPVTQCYETAIFSDQSCEWEVTGEQPEAPVTECYETVAFNDTTCEWEVTGEQPEAPVTECYETATFSDQTCEWEVTGEQPEIPETKCFETATFNKETCSWDITGEEPEEPLTKCFETATFNNETCSWDITGEQPEAPATACYEVTTFNEQTCEWEVTGEQPEAPVTACYETATFSDQTCEWEVTGEQPEEPVTACYEIATFNVETCVWDITGEQPEAPVTKCNETATFNEEACAWEITETALPYAGENGNLTVCSGTSPTDSELFEALGGSPDEDGIWTGPINGDYTYTVSGSGSCPDDIAFVKVYEYQGTENIIDEATICSGDSYTWAVDGNSYILNESPVVLNLNDANGCAYTATLILNEDMLTSIQHPSFDSICLEDGTFVLSGGIPEGGFYYGPGVIDNGNDTYSFNPEIGTGVYGIGYAIDFKDKCLSRTKFKIRVIECEDKGKDSRFGSLFNFTAYPVPYGKEINITFDFDFNTDISIQVTDIRGMILEDIHINDYVKNSERKTRIDLSDAKDQILFIKVSTIKGSVVKKIVPSNKKR